jgi:vacuolar-type H+-ATPase subunit B/Vma2
MLTITEAAKEAGLTRAAIHKAIKTGRLSAAKTDNGNYLIDPAELFRVYSRVKPTISKKFIEVETSVDTVDYRLMAQRLEFTERLLKQAEEERDNLRISLNQAMLLITHQPEPEIPKPESRPVKSLLWEKLFGRRS